MASLTVVSGFTPPVAIPRSTSFRYRNVDFEVYRNHIVTCNEFRNESTTSLFRLLRPVADGALNPVHYPRTWWQAQCAFRGLPSSTSVGTLGWILRRFLMAELEQFTVAGTVTQFPRLEEAAERAWRKMMTGGFWTDLEPEEQFVRNPYRFLTEMFIDLESGRRSASRGIGGGSHVSPTDPLERAYWFTGDDSWEKLFENLDTVWALFRGTEEDDPVLVLTIPLGDRPTCEDGRFVGQMWNENAGLHHTLPGDNYSGLTWTRRGVQPGFIVATSNRAAELKIVEFSHRNEMERMDQRRRATGRGAR